MTPQELKTSILQMAIQGKLVEQRPEEGTGEELFQQIQAKKQALFKSGKIKKEKNIPEITEDEIPFDIPDNWRWCRITECGEFISGYTPKPSELSVSGTLPYFKVSDMNTPGNELFLVNTSNYLVASTSKCFFKNTIVYPKNGGAVFTNKKRILAQNSVVDLNTGGYYPIAPLDLMFVYIFFSNIDFRKCYKGTALPTIDMEKLKSKLFPLPPLAEQKRIVAKIKELLPLIDRYEQAWSKLEAFNKRFPTDMQKSILQMAIQGKLVEQRPEEGTGEELFQQIQAEKQALIKAGKIKKEKPLPEIAEDEIPFAVPENWCWVRLRNIVKKLTDGSHNPPANSGIGYPVISAKNVKNGLITLENVDRYTDEVGFKKENPRTNISKGDIIMGIIGGSIGNIGIYTHDEQVIAQRSVAIIDSMIDSAYLVYVLKSPLLQNAMLASAAGSAQGGVYLGTLSNFLIPLPPLAEQKRIVAKLEEILPLCERLK